MHPHFSLVAVISYFCLSIVVYTSSATMNPSLNLPPPWLDSDAKKQLRKDILENKVTEKSKPKDVYAMHPVYKLYEYKNFSANLRSLKKKIKRDKAHALFDKEAIEHDRRLFPRPAANAKGELLWHGSAAEPLLKIDVAAGVHNTMQPKALWHSKAAYQEHSLHTFRKHITQAQRDLTTSAFRKHKQEQKEKNKKL